jgi:hypothetical protein
MGASTVAGTEAFLIACLLPILAPVVVAHPMSASAARIWLIVLL